MEQETEKTTENPTIDLLKLRQQKLEEKTSEKHALYDIYACPVRGAQTLLRNMRRHVQTKKHQDALDLWFDRFAMK